MTAAALDLQRALFEALSLEASLVEALGGRKFHDVTPAELGFPYITFGRTDVYDWSTGTEDGSELLLTLHVWSKHKGRKEALELMALVRGALHDRHLVLAAHQLVNLRLASAEVRFDEDIAAYDGIMRFRAVVETS